MKRSKTLDIGMMTLCALAILATTGCVGKRDCAPPAALQQVPPVFTAMTQLARDTGPRADRREVPPPPTTRDSSRPPPSVVAPIGPPADESRDGVPLEDSPDKAANRPGDVPRNQQEFIALAGLPTIQDLGTLTVPQLQRQLADIESWEDDDGYWDLYGKANVQGYIRWLRSELHTARMAGDRFGD